MKTQWIAVAVLSAAFSAGCGEKTPENGENTSQNEGTTVTVPQETGTQGNLQPVPAEPAAASSNRDGSTRSSNTVAGSTSRQKPSAPARNESGPAARIPSDAPRLTAAPAPRPAPVVRFVTIPVGTALPLELTTAVSSATAEVEMPVSAKLRRAVTVNGETVLPAGAVVSGEVSEVDRAGRVKGRSRLALRFTSVVIDGRRESLRTNPVSFEGEATKSEDATKIGAGAGIGAAIGGLLGGGSGAAKGAVIGGAAGTGAVVATRGKEVELAAGADLNPTLASPVEVEVR
jgi:hypothetical protein